MKTTNSLKTLADVARAYGFHRNTIAKWFRRADAPVPGPGGYEADELGKFIEKCAATEGSQAKASPKLMVLKCAEIAERTRKLKLANDEKAKALIPRSQFEHEIREMSSEVQKQMYAIPPRAPELAGLPVAEIEAKLTEMIDAAVRNLADGARAIDPATCPLCRQRKVEVTP